MSKCLIKVTGWIGDCFFALSLPEKLRNELGYTHIDFLSYRPQPILLLKQNKYINNVYYQQLPNNNYDSIFDMPVIEDKSIAPTIQLQKSCGLTKVNSEFNIDSVPSFDSFVKDIYGVLRPKKIITYQGDWADRSWSVTEEERKNRLFNNSGIYPHFKTLRPGNIMQILNKLKERLKDTHVFIPISPYGINNNDQRGYCTDTYRYACLASSIKLSDFFLGAEGGMCNLAAGLGTKCIITTCHMEVMFGANGLLGKCKDIQLGPAKLFPNKGHINLDPFLTDLEIETQIYNTII